MTFFAKEEEREEIGLPDPHSSAAAGGAAPRPAPRCPCPARPGPGRLAGPGPGRGSPAPPRLQPLWAPLSARLGAGRTAARPVSSSAPGGFWGLGLAPSQHKNLGKNLVSKCF